MHSPGALPCIPPLRNHRCPRQRTVSGQDNRRNRPEKSRDRRFPYCQQQYPGVLLSGCSGEQNNCPWALSDQMVQNTVKRIGYFCWDRSPCPARIEYRVLYRNLPSCPLRRDTRPDKLLQDQSTGYPECCRHGNNLPMPPGTPDPELTPSSPAGLLCP